MKLDLNLLKRLLVIKHPSKYEWPMLSFIINECYRIKNLEFQMDDFANIFITKNTNNPEYYPCVVAHTDEVLAHKNKEVVIKNGKIKGRDRLTGKRIGLGMDDANGICCALQLLKVIPDLKVCFTTEEEIGFNGADCAADNLDFFYNVSYLIQADRRGSSDLITYTNFIYSASEEWLEEATPIMAKYGYSEQAGIGTDIGVLAEKLQISGVNISCGYNKEHTDQEYTVIKDLENCLNFMEALLLNIPCERSYEIKINYKAYNTYYPSYKSKFNSYNRLYDGGFDPYDDDWDYPETGPKESEPEDWENWCRTCKTMDCMHCPHDNVAVL